VGGVRGNGREPKAGCQNGSNASHRD
jgi:hypothetical protein